MSNAIYCNPVPLPEMQESFPSIFKDKSGYMGEVMDFRDAADPEVLYYEGKWYMYPSQGQAFVSSDLVNWEYHPIDIEIPLGYAPAVTMSNGKVYLTASLFRGDGKSRIFEAPTPLGPFKCIGEPLDMNGKPLQAYLDPAMFTDDDGRMFLYWGCAPSGGGIYGMEVDSANPCRGISEVKKLIDFNGDNWWEREGEYGETLDYGWDEGASMYKYNGKYYLQYSSNGTPFRAYAISTYIGEGPLGPFKAPTKPTLLKRNGIVCGTGHGGMFTGPEGKPWMAYCIAMHRVHMFERRIAIDPVTFDADGFPTVEASDTPRYVSGTPTGMVPLSFSKLAETSSSLPGCCGSYAIDECAHTYWGPLPEDMAPSITIDLRFAYDIRAFRIIWAELNLNYEKGITPQPVKYKVTFMDKEKKTVYVYDAMDNSRELQIDFRLLEAPIVAHYAKLEFERPEKMHLGVTDFTIFGNPSFVTRV